MGSKSVIALCVLIWVANCAALDSITLKGNWGWNELLRAKGIFDNQLNDIQTKFSHEAVLLDQLEQLLATPNFVEDLYRKYQLLFPKSLSSMDYSSRLEVFGKTLKEIAKHNLNAHKGESTWVKGVNQFTDMTNEEFYSKYTSNTTLMEESMKSSGENMMKGFSQEFLQVPDKLDWRDSGIISPPMDQNPCGVCGVVSGLAHLEALVAKESGKEPVHLSIQEMMDCGGITCDNGASPNNVWEKIRSIGGVGPDSAYPYQAKDTFNCRSAGIPNIANVADFHYENNVDEETLKTYVAKSPGATYVYITSKDYSGGIWQASDCGDNEAGHSVFLIGYGSEDGHDYWIIKNSWGTWWGENGFYRLQRNLGKTPGACQIGNAFFFLTIADPK